MGKILSAFLIWFMVPHHSWGLQLKKLRQPVVDDVGVLSPNTIQSLNAKLHQINDAGVAQIQIYLTPTLDGLTIEEAAIKWVDYLKLGDAKKDNGVLFLIAPNERRMRIEVGQGLEGDITDAQAKRIIEDYVGPQFRRSNFDAGVSVGTDAIIGLLQHDPNALPTQRARSKEGFPVVFVGVVILMLVLLSFVRGSGRGFRRNVDYWGTGGPGTWGGGSSSGWGGSSGSGGSWGGGGGGGGFSGGGASGGW